MTLPWRIIALLFALSLIVIGGILVFAAPAAVPEHVLAERIQRANPRWSDYDEDVKGQLGARPVAEWRGRPIRAEAHLNGQIHVTFHIEGPWAGRTVAIPVLLRHPYGNVLNATETHVEQDEVTYSFRLPAPTGDRPKWVEVRYPHGTRRIVLDADGHWNAP